MKWGSEGPFNFADNTQREIEGVDSINLAATWMEFPHLTEEIQHDIVGFFLTNCDNCIKGRVQQDNCATDVPTTAKYE